MLQIKISSKAISDIENSIEWYNSQSDGLGERFLNSIHETFMLIQSMPSAASYAYDTVRYKVVKRFPYVILYEHDEEHVYIYRVFNTYQKPT